MRAVEATGLPLAEGLETVEDLPHTITFAINYRQAINQYQEMPSDKRPPRNLWDKPSRLKKFLEEAWETGTGNNSKEYIDFDYEDVE